jgi:hypothetical protein
MLLSGKYKPKAFYPENENSDFLIIPLSDDEIETMLKTLFGKAIYIFCVIILIPA